ncbi:MAG: leucine-rich repeat protein [Clostridia bacterium]|nr:leucine-rich repeat protein [Clostridia bacterium]
MDFKKTTRQHADRKYIQMLDGSTPPPYESDTEIDASRTYSSKRDRYYNRLSQERSEFNSALSKVQSAEGARLRSEEADIEAKARSRYKLFKMLKTIAFLLPIVLVVFTGINIFSRNYYYVSSIDFESIWIFGMFASVILAIILIVSLYKKEIYYSRTNVKNGVKFSALAIIVTAVTILVGILFLSAKPSVSSKDDFVFIKGDRGCVLIEYKGDAEIVILPEKYEGEAYQISYEAFSGDNVKSMTKLVIPATATGSCNFRNCTSLKDVEAPASSVGNLPKTIETLFINGGKGQMYADFRDYTSLKSLIIADTIESIQSDTFSGCTALETVVIGSGITSISSGMFEGCTSLTNLTIKGNASVGYSAFNGCNNIKNLTCYAGVLDNFSFNTVETVSIIGGEEIPSYAFENCTLLKSVTINSVTSIGGRAFHGCTALTSVTMSDSVTAIGNSAFQGCSALESITLPESLTRIENGAFQGCSVLKSITIPSKVTQIGNGAFVRCSSLVSLTIPDSVTSVGREAFKYCTSLKELVIGNGLTTIPDGILEGCSSLESLTIPFVGSNKDFSSSYYSNNFGHIFGSNEFDGAKKTEQHYSNQWRDYHNYFIPNTLKSVTVNGGTLAYGAFGNCSEIERISLGANVKEIGECAFSACHSLKSVNIPSQITIIEKAVFSSCTALESISIPEGVITIGANAFSNCSSLTQITIPSSVTTIGNSAFSNCNSLLSVTIPSNVITIEDYAFNNCNKLVEIYNLTSLDISSASDSDLIIHTSSSEQSVLKTINDYVFWTRDNKIYLMAYKGNITEITLPDSYNGKDYEIYKYAFYYQDDITKITIPSGVTAIGTYAIANATSLENVTIPNSVTSIADYAFSNCTALKYNVYDTASYLGNADNPFLWLMNANDKKIASCQIHEDTKYINNSAFYNCTALTSITIPDGVTTIGKSAFQNCTALASIVVPGNVKIIGAYAFSDCTSLISATISDGVTKIGNYAFYDCDLLETITIPSSITEMGEYILPDSVAMKCNAYDNALYLGNDTNPYLLLLNVTDENITSCKIHENTKFIYSSAFYDCDSLTSITIPDSVTTIGDSAFRSCESLESVTIGNGVSQVGNDAFDYCYSISTVNYLGTLEKWCNISFSNEYSTPTYYAETFSIKGVLLTDLVIPNSITEIKDYIFNNCDSITSVVIPNGVTKIGDCVFSNCAGITSITIPSSVTEIGEQQFINCNRLEIVNYLGTLEQWCNISFFDEWSNPQNYSHSLNINGATITELVIPDAITEIKPYAFYGNNAIKSITIGKGLTKIGEQAFLECTAIENIVVSKDNANYKSVDGSLYSKDGKTLVLYAIGKQDTTFEIPNSVAIIADEAFAYSKYLKTVKIPNSVTELGKSVFLECNSLEEVLIPDSVISMGNATFWCCYRLKTVTLPSGLTKIGYQTFYHCSSLESITIPSGVTEIGGYAFSGCSKLKSITLPSVLETIEGNAFSSCSALESITIPASVKTIEIYAFSYCTALKSVIFEDASGWEYSTWSGFSPSYSLNYLSDASTAAKYLTSSYDQYYWRNK